MPAMLGCSTVCPNCKHQFTCCAPVPPCCTSQRSPQVSPSAPLSFVLPPFVVPQPPPLTQPENEVIRLRKTIQALKTSGWYYEGLTFDRSDELLKDTKVGTFLVRNSSNPRYLFSLSVQTDSGPKSVRLFYCNGYFRLDAQTHLQLTMPLFPGVVELVEHYVRRRKDGQVWVDPQGKCLSDIYLDKPLKREDRPSSLKHLSRLAINRVVFKDTSKTRVLKLELPASLTAYLMEYPYSL